jgi:GNAT superfamily N-acetyltransferase
MKIINITAENAVKNGFFCKMSQKKSGGYKRKLEWLQQRFNEGLRIKMLDLKEGGRGFIEYIPGEYAWRAINAEGYMVIHCLWVVGSSKGKGYSTLLLNECIEDAKKSGMKGVAMVTSEGNWLAGKDILVKNGFEMAEEILPFSLMVKKFKKASSPSFPTDWDKRTSVYKKGLTVIRTDQCPYIDDAARIVEETAAELKIPYKAVELKSAEDVRKLSPAPFGVFSIILNGKLLSYCYQLKKDLIRLIKEEG